MAKQSNPSKSRASANVPVRWLEVPQAHDYPAAASYLSLIAGPKAVAKTIKALQEVPTVTFKAKDLLRPAGLPLLPADDPDVARGWIGSRTVLHSRHAWLSAAASRTVRRRGLPMATTGSARHTT